MLLNSYANAVFSAKIIFQCENLKLTFSYYGILNSENKDHNGYWIQYGYIFVMWLGCRFIDTEVDGSNPISSMLCL